MNKIKSARYTQRYSQNIRNYIRKYFQNIRYIFQKQLFFKAKLLKARYFKKWWAQITAKLIGLLINS